MTNSRNVLLDKILPLGMVSVILFGILGWVAYPHVDAAYMTGMYGTGLKAEIIAMVVLATVYLISIFAVMKGVERIWWALGRETDVFESRDWVKRMGRRFSKR